MRDEDEMGFTFMQVGCSHDAAEFLHEVSYTHTHNMIRTWYILRDKLSALSARAHTHNTHTVAHAPCSCKTV